LQTNSARMFPVNFTSIGNALIAISAANAPPALSKGDSQAE
jgi:hypothetical protein